VSDHRVGEEGCLSTLVPKCLYGRALSCAIGTNKRNDRSGTFHTQINLLSHPAGEPEKRPPSFPCQRSNGQPSLQPRDVGCQPLNIRLIDRFQKTACQVVSQKLLQVNRHDFSFLGPAPHFIRPLRKTVKLSSQNLDKYPLRKSAPHPDGERPSPRPTISNFHDYEWTVKPLQVLDEIDFATHNLSIDLAKGKNPRRKTSFDYDRLPTEANETLLRKIAGKVEVGLMYINVQVPPNPVGIRVESVRHFISHPCVIPRNGDRFQGNLTLMITGVQRGVTCIASRHHSFGVKCHSS